VLGPEHADTLSSADRLAAVLVLEGRYTEADSLQRETLEIRRRVLGPEHQDTLISMDNLAFALLEEDKRKVHESEKLFREALAVQSRSLGPEHPDTLRSMSGLFNVLWLEGDFSGAEKMARQALAIERRVLGPEHPRTLDSMNQLAISLIEEGHYPKRRSCIATHELFSSVSSAPITRVRRFQPTISGVWLRSKATVCRHCRS